MRLTSWPRSPSLPCAVDAKKGHGVLHPLNEACFGAQWYHGKGARMQAPEGCQLICLQGCIGRLQHLHQPLVQMQILSPLQYQGYCERPVLNGSIKMACGNLANAALSYCVLQQQIGW